jgi:DNA-binding MltR family transcriptional regulator
LGFFIFELSVGQSEKYRSQEVASNKLEKGPLRDNETAFCLLLALTVLEKKIFKD